MYFNRRKKAFGSITRQKARNEKTGRVLAVIVFIVFTLVGGGMLYPLGIRPIKKTVAAQSWPEVACEIISAEVDEHNGEKGSTYSIDIVYEYEFDGRIYESDKYDFIGGSSSGYNGKAKVVERYKSARNPVCFVNPENPSEAVLLRGFHLGLLFALFPLPFLAVGVGGLIWTIKHPPGNKLRSTTKQWLPETEAEPAVGVMPISDSALKSVVMKSKSPWAVMVLSIVIAAFWNGIVSIFVVDVIDKWQSGDGNWPKTLFMVPFVAIGVFLIGSIFYCMLALFNPRLRLTLSSAIVSLGGVVQLKWDFSGRTNIIQNLKILLRGKEQARYRRGTNTYTDKNTFFQMEVYSTQDRREIPSGEIGFAVPSESMHSFEAENNKIIWEIEVSGDIRSWPDVKEVFKIAVTPSEVEQQ